MSRYSLLLLATASTVSTLGRQGASKTSGAQGTWVQGGQWSGWLSEAYYLDLAMSVLILSTFFCFSFNSSGLNGVSGSRSMYRSGMRTLSGVESCGEPTVTTYLAIPSQAIPLPQPLPDPLTSLLISTS